MSSNTIKIKAGSGTPTTSDIQDKELAFDRSADKLYINDAGTIVDLTGSGATGDIEGVTAGTGLSGGGTSGTVNLDIDLTEVGFGGGANRLITDDGDGTVSTEANLTFNGTYLDFNDSRIRHNNATFGTYDWENYQQDDGTLIWAINGTGGAEVTLSADGSDYNTTFLQLGNKIRFATNGNSYINTSNNVGIGTNSPSNLLHLDGTYPQLRLNASGDTTYTTFGSGTSFAVFNIVNPSTKTYEFRNNGTEQLSITTGGVVNIPGSLTLGTALALAEGGTGATTAAAARFNLNLGDLAILDSISADLITSGTIADARIALSSITQHTDPKYLRSNADDQSTGVLTVDTLKITNDASNTSRHRVAVFDSGSTSYGMMLWNSNGTGGDWGTMIYGPNQANRRISFGKINNATFADHGDVTEIAHFDLDDSTLRLTADAYVNSNKVWHAGNDGSGTGLDADLLDGNHGSHYLNAGNLTGTLDADRIPNLAASKITSGTFSTARIPNLAASKITSGTFDAARIAHNSFHLGATSAETGRTVKETGLYTYEVNNGNLGTGTETGYYEVLTWGEGTGGSVQLAGQWFGGTAPNMYFRTLRDVSDDWTTWQRLLTTSDEGSGNGLDADTLDGLQGSSYWTKSGGWAGDLTSNGWTRVQGVSSGGGEFVLAQKSGQISTLIDGS